MGFRVMLRLAYDGSRYCGWQRQTDQPTVQQEVEKAVLNLSGEKASVIASGRTDSGVHARGQVCHFNLESSTIPPEKFSLALNRLLPSDIRILESREVGEDFHARFSALRREYRYYLSRTGIPDPFGKPHCYARSDIPSVGILDGYATFLIGERDFTTFSAAGDPSESKIRYIYAASFFPEKGYTVFRIVGNAFLWKMVRSLLGTMLELGRNESPPEGMRDLINGRDRSLAGPTAPSKGLFLHKVEYDERYTR